jgi:F-type H+-transporting ATPase subunit delta
VDGSMNGVMCSRLSARCRVFARSSFKGAALRTAAPLACRRHHSQSQRRQAVAEIGAENVGANYAIALVELASEADDLEKVHQDMDALASIFAENAEVKDHFANPVVPEEDKQELLEKLCKDADFSQHTQNFLGLLVQARRFEVIDEIVTAFETEYCKITDTQVATLTSAVQLEQEQQFLIAKKLQELTGSKNIKLKPQIDESLIAGFIVKYGSSEIDLSVKGQLNKISNELVEAAS